MHKVSAVFLVAVFGSLNATAQIYKCPDASGRLAMQQTPCAGGTKLDVRPASGRDPVPAPAQTPAQTADASSSAPIKSTPGTKTLEQERLARERWIKLNDARFAASNQRRNCEREQAAIAAQKSSSNNNLAGATRDVSISGEMQAAATLCQSKVRSADRFVDQLKSDCDRMGCTAPTGLE